MPVAAARATGQRTQVTTAHTSSTTQDLLRALRQGRGFVATDVLDAKVGCINQWWRCQHLDAAVLGLSGGIDSAVVLMLLHRASQTPGSPIRRLVAIAAPITAVGATGQSESVERARLVAAHVGIELWECPLAEPQAGMVDALRSGSNVAPNAWVQGQMLSVLRTPLFYGAAALLQQQGFRSVVVGTTNRDEGAYLGFFGKASDAMVDVQPIGDLHKQEVRALAALLEVPSEIVDAEPDGNVWDGRTDAEMIGASYDQVELVLRLREMGVDPSEVARRLADGAAGDLPGAIAAIELLHDHNRHKFQVGSPAVFLDVLPRAVPGGWESGGASGGDHARHRDRPPPEDSVPGWWRPPDDLLPDRAAAAAATSAIAVLHSERIDILSSWAVVTPPVLDVDETNRLLDAMRDHATPAPVGVTGAIGRPNKADGIGSFRATAWSPDLADALWRRLKPAVPSVRFLAPHDATDGYATDTRVGYRSWRVVGLSPLLRFMRYEAGGHHLVHYDAGYDYGDGRRTLLSVVLFLTGDDEPSHGGHLRFVDDRQAGFAVWERNHEDWDRPTMPHEVVAAIAPTRGAAVVFDHRLPHDVEPWNGPKARAIIRADVVYEAINDGRGLP